MSAYLHHLTINTGHLHRASREDMDDGVLAVVSERLEAALDAPDSIVTFPGPQTLGLKVIAEGRGMVATLYAAMTDKEAAVADSARSPWEPLVTLGVAPRDTVGARLWPMLLAAVDDLPQGLRRPRAPWAAAVLHPLQDTRRLTTMSWIGSAEQIIAWAWLER